MKCADAGSVGHGDVGDDSIPHFDPMPDEMPLPNDTSSDAASEAAPETIPTSLENQLAAAIAERDAARDRLLRATADFENTRKRLQREVEENRRYQALSIVRDILAPLDNLFRAVTVAEAAAAHAKKEPSKVDPLKTIDDLLTGVKMVAKQFDTALATHNAVPIDPVGKAFDPNLHEAVTQLTSADYPPGTVLQEVERGYRMHDRIIRPSRVIVAKAD